MKQVHRLSIALGLGVLACGGGAEEVSYSDAVTADPDHYAVEFENDAVRVLRVNYGPGESSVMHTHPAHCAVALNDATWRMEDPAGEVAELSTPMGELVCVEEGVHLPENATDVAAQIILVEMKGGQPGPATSEHPDAVAADPGHYTVEWENDAVRLVRANYAPGETSVLHHHSAYCFVGLGDGNWQMTDAEGTTTDLAIAHGQFACLDAEVHSPKNMSSEAGGAILIEFKGRETVE
jgi:quercetin dioxygenase-like cupin family protein